jgi:hypothetical protein
MAFLDLQGMKSVAQTPGASGLSVTGCFGQSGASITSCSGPHSLLSVTSCN